MRRIGLWGLMVAFFCSSSLGCGDSPKVVRGKDPFKARQQTQKEKNQGTFMTPKGVKTDK